LAHHEDPDFPPGHAGARCGDQLAGGFAWLFWAQVAGNLGFFVAVLFLARGLAPSDRGAVAFLTVTALVVTRISRFGVTEATMVFAARTPSGRPELLSNLLLASFVTACGSVLLVSGGMLVVHSARPEGVGDRELAILAGALLASSLVDAGYSFLLGCGRFRPHALVTSSASWLYALLLGLVWQLQGLTVARAVLAWTVAQAFRGIALLLACLWDVRPGRPRLDLLRESITFGLRAWIGTLARFFTFRLDQILMAFIASEAALGVYAVAVNASEVLFYVPQAMASAILPLVSASQREQRVDETLGAFRSLVLVTGASVIVAYALGPVLMPLVFGHAYEASVVPFFWLLPGALGYAALGVFSSSLLAADAPGRSSLGPLVALVSGVGLDILLIPLFGATGAAAAASASFVLGGLVSLVIYRRREPFEWRVLAVPHRHDLVLLRALGGPLWARVSSRPKLS
jgi:O-antigen/teichoic acid export membrane protein